jgi:hypothetical protein
VVKSEKRGDLLDDLKETSDNLRKFKMMLNPKKCVFGVSSGKLLGYMVSSQGIDVNPKKMEAIEKHSGMDSTGQQLRMTRWKSTPIVKSASSFRSKL